eukprot:Gb_08299 [translate_table: standard]
MQNCAAAPNGGITRSSLQLYKNRDVRILDAVDAPNLHHLVDCLAFPQKGHRPHPNEASGSDLDGDVYFVSWDSRLIPPSGESWEPMDYAPGATKESKHPVTTEVHQTLSFLHFLIIAQEEPLLEVVILMEEYL